MDWFLNDSNGPILQRIIICCCPKSMAFLQMFSQNAPETCYPDPFRLAENRSLPASSSLSSPCCASTWNQWFLRDSSSQGENSRWVFTTGWLWPNFEAQARFFLASVFKTSMKRRQTNPVFRCPQSVEPKWDTVPSATSTWIWKITSFYGSIG